MKKKSLRIILSLTLCVLLVTMFSATAFAAGDVSGTDRGQQCDFPCDRHDPRHPVLCQGRYLVFRVQKTRPVRVRCALHTVCLPHLYSDCAPVYLVDLVSWSSVITPPERTVKTYV